MKPLILLMIFLFCQSRVEARITERTIEAVDLVQKSDAPPLASLAAIFPVKEEATELDQMIEKLNKVVFPNAEGFKVRFSSLGNVVSDTYRKFVIFDPAFFQHLKSVPNPRLALMWILSHEIAHYVVNYNRSKTGKDRLLEVADLPGILLQPRHPKKDTVQYYMDHVETDAVAAEIMKRAGYSNREIELASRSTNRALAEAVVKLAETESVPRIMSDLFNRNLVLNQWIVENPEIPPWQTSVSRAGKK